MIDQLVNKIRNLNNPTVVGLDPRLDLVPKQIKEEAYDLYGRSLKGAAHAFYLFNTGLIDAVSDLIPAVKPQVAMYEELGYDGLKAYMDTIAYAKEKGLIVIGDIKRSDIASTAQSYSNGHIGRVNIEGELIHVYKEDFITLNPYLGIDSIDPYFENCSKYDKGMFVLVKTSNPNSGETQDVLVTEKQEAYYEYIGGLVSKWGEGFIGESGFSKIGAVVGATHKEQGIKLRQLMPHTFFLVPGYGAQGATAQDLAGCFNQEGIGAIVNSSRGIIAAYKLDKYKNDYTEVEFAAAARQAVLDMKADLNRVI